MAERVGARDRLYTALIFRLENPDRILMSTQAIVWTSQSVWADPAHVYDGCYLSSVTSNQADARR
jgi:hypothetical protein